MISFSDIQIERTKSEALKDGALYGEFSIGPVPQGYGYTLANSLRRVLLSSIPGYSITSVRINDLAHEFTTIPGVKENVLDIVLRLKNIRFRVKGEDELYVITANVSGRKGPFKAKDLMLPGEVEVVNKDYVIAHITDDSANFQMEATLEKGIGYRQADDKLRDEIGRIPVDAIFSPVKLVSYEVVPSRKGGSADYDKVILKIQTDGGITPEKALVEAISILSNFFDTLKQTPVLKGEQEEGAEELEVKEEQEAPSIEEADIEILGLGKSITDKLKTAGLGTIKDLKRVSLDEIAKIPGIGQKAIEKIKKALNNVNE